MSKIRIGIVGYGNLGRGAEASVQLQPDMELVAVFSRRNDLQTVSGIPVYTMNQMKDFKGKIDVMILCGGSATDLIVQTPAVARDFVCIDSFDTHPRITEHFTTVDKAAKEGGTAALISCGWDPGMFSLQRVFAESILPQGKTYTFWGRGVSQGHSDAIRRIEGVLDARQYTVPKEAYLNAIRSGETNYFVGYETAVHFISQKELDRDHKGIPHGGFVMRSGESTKGTSHVIEYSLKLDSNPEFTGSVLTAYARGLHRLASHGAKGAFTVFDIPPAWISTKSDAELRSHLL